MRPPLRVIFETGLPEAFFREFSDSVSNEELTVELIEKSPMGPLAGIMWMLPTLSAVYLAKPFFDGFLKEAGKDAYEILKRALAKLAEQTAGLPVRVVATPGKVDHNDPYSNTFSIYAEIPDGNQVKLLIPKNAENTDYCLTTFAFVDFVKSCYEDGGPAFSEVRFDLFGKPRSDLIPVTYNTETGEIERADIN